MKSRRAHDVCENVHMFTGIITGVGRIAAVHDLGTSSSYGKRLSIEAPDGYLDDVGLGDSIALNGACMTVTTLDPERQQFTIDISAESLDKTAGLTDAGSRINLEKALRASDRLGGHIVSRPRGRHRHRELLRAGRRKLGAARGRAARRWPASSPTRARSPSTA